MATLWQMLTKKISPDLPKTSVVINPLKAKIGSSVQFDVLDYRDMTFFVKEVREVARYVNGKNFPFTDYTLMARPLGGEDVTVKLRLMPVTNVSPGDDLTHNTVLLQKYDELPWDQGFRDILNENEFVTKQDDVETGRYWRINDVKGGYQCVVKIVDSANEKEELGFKRDEIEYWDYWREYQDEAGQPDKEFLFIEMEKSNGFFTIWKGQEINAKRVDVR